MAVQFYTQLLVITLCLYTSCQARSHFRLGRGKYLGKSVYDLSGAASSPSLAYAPRPQPPMQFTGNYNLIMPDYYDHHPAESMQLQNFANFHDAQMSPGADLGMEESQHPQFLTGTPVRAPQPLSETERRVRAHLIPVDVQRERKVTHKLKKGSTQPRGEGYAQWDQFDYDAYSFNPGDSKKYNSYDA